MFVTARVNGVMQIFQNARFANIVKMRTHLTAQIKPRMVRRKEEGGRWENIFVTAMCMYSTNLEPLSMLY